MKKYSINFIVLILLSFIAYNCSDMNDKHAIYMQDGERIYIGKTDSTHVFSGNMRSLFRVWVSDPRAKSVLFQWEPNNDSVWVPIVRSSITDPIEFIIGIPGGLKSLPEGNYAFSIRTSDDKGNYSIPVEKMINIYGESFQVSLTNRAIRSAKQTETNVVEFVFSNPINEKEIGIRINYVDAAGISQSKTYLNADISNPLIIENIDESAEVSYSSLFVPEADGIDTFAATEKDIEITKL